MFQGVADGVVNTTAWPSANAVSQSWDVELMREWAMAMGQENRLKGEVF